MTTQCEHGYEPGMCLACAMGGDTPQEDQKITFKEAFKEVVEDDEKLALTMNGLAKGLMIVAGAHPGNLEEMVAKESENAKTRQKITEDLEPGILKDKLQEAGKQMEMTIDYIKAFIAIREEFNNALKAAIQERKAQ